MFERILVPIDGSATSKRGVREAIAVAKLTSARIKLMHVFERPLLGIGSEAALLRGDDIYNVARDAGQELLSDAAASVKADINAYRSTYLEAYLLSTMAIAVSLLAVIPAIVPEDAHAIPIKLALALFEVIMIARIIFVVWRGQNGGWHERWLRCRAYPPAACSRRRPTAREM